MAAALTHYLQERYANSHWEWPYYNQTTVTIDDLYNAMGYSISTNYPLVIMARIESGDAVFTYTTAPTKHFLVVVGVYTNTTGVKRVVLADPYPTSDPQFDPTQPTAYSYLDLEFSELWAISRRCGTGLICNDFILPLEPRS